jgi:hypothetical protein
VRGPNPPPPSCLAHFATPLLTVVDVGHQLARARERHGARGPPLGCSERGRPWGSSRTVRGVLRSARPPRGRSGKGSVSTSTQFCRAKEPQHRSPSGLHHAGLRHAATQRLELRPCARGRRRPRRPKPPLPGHPRCPAAAHRDELLRQGGVRRSDGQEGCGRRPGGATVHIHILTQCNACGRPTRHHHPPPHAPRSPPCRRRPPEHGRRRGHLLRRGRRVPALDRCGLKTT